MSQTSSQTSSQNAQDARQTTIEPSGLFPPEWRTWTCPACGSSNTIITTRPTGRGTGPHGRWRLGDSGRNVKACLDCGKASDGCGLVGLPGTKR